MKRLNLGCGGDYKEGWINVEVLKSLKADKHYDLNKIPYPFKDNTFDEVLMQMILEHLEDPIAVLKEIIRISKAGAKLTITVPHAFNYSNITDLQHKHNFSENSFDKSLLKEYGLEELELKKREFFYQTNKWKKFIPFKGILKIFLNGVYDDILFEFRINKRPKTSK